MENMRKNYKDINAQMLDCAFYFACRPLWSLHQQYLSCFVFLFQLFYSFPSTHTHTDCTAYLVSFFEHIIEDFKEKPTKVTKKFLFLFFSFTHSSFWIKEIKKSNWKLCKTTTHSASLHTVKLIKEATFLWKTVQLFFQTKLSRHVSLKMQPIIDKIWSSIYL